MVLETNECIQHLLPPPEPPVEKRCLHRSQHDPTALPSYSQIGLQGLNLLAMNTSGEDRSAPFSIGTHCLKGSYHTFGRPRNDQRVHNPITRNSNGTVSPQMNLSNTHRVPNSEKWKETYTELIEGAKDRRIQSLPALRHHKSTHTREERKPPVPLRMEEPIFGLRSEKNYIASNKKECVMTLKKPLRCSSQSPIHRADYGQVPQYLRDIQKRLKDEKQYLQQLKSSAEEMKKTEVPPFLHVIDAKEREEMVEALKVRLEEKQKAYFALPFTLDTSKAIQRKEGMEKEIQMIENALNELQKEVVVVYMTHNAYQANIAREEALKRAQKIAVAQRISHTNSSTTREECVGTPNH